jgi:hypothetical protein
MAHTKFLLAPMERPSAASLPKVQKKVARDRFSKGDDPARKVPVKRVRLGLE